MLYSKSENWRELELFSHKKLIRPLITHSIDDLKLNPKLLENIYQGLVKSLTNECTKVVKRFRKSDIDAAYWRPIHRHLTTKFSLLHENTAKLSNIQNKLRDLSENLLDIQVMLDQSTKFVRINLNKRENLPKTNFIDKLSGCNNCSTDLNEINNFRIFRMMVNLDNFNNAQNYNKKGCIFVTAVFRKSSKPFDIGHYTLMFVKFIDKTILDCLF